MANKVAYSRLQNYGGVFLFSLAQDYKYSPYSLQGSLRNGLLNQAEFLSRVNPNPLCRDDSPYINRMCRPPYNVICAMKGELFGIMPNTVAFTYHDILAYGVNFPSTLNFLALNNVTSNVASFFVTALDVLSSPILATRIYALNQQGFTLGHDFLNFDFTQVRLVKKEESEL